MASWDQVEFGFCGDETSNFGPRVESGSALFQVDTTALITPSEKVTEAPKVNAVSSGPNLCVAADSHASFFTEEGASYSGTLAFDSTVDALCWCFEGILVVCERNGTVHFIDGTTPKPLFSQIFVPHTDPSQKTFVSVSFSKVSDCESCELLILTKDRLFTLSNIQLGAECDIKSLQKKIKMSVVDISLEHTEGTTSAQHLGNYGNAVITTGGGESVLTVWMSVDGSLEPFRRMRGSLSEAIVKVGVLEHGRFLLALDEKGNLSLLHTHTLTLVYRWTNSNIADFIFLDVDDVDSITLRWCDMKLAVLTRDHTLQVVSLRHLTAEYTLSMNPFAHLVHGPPQQEDVFFIEGVDEVKNGASLITSLRVRCLAEVQPETRFNRMLHKKQFEKAEALARDFNLDIELVYKVKATGLLDHLSPWSVDKLSEKEADQLTAELLSCLEHITDEDLIVECCVKATPPKMEKLYDLLVYAKKRLSKGSDDKEGSVSNSSQKGDADANDKQRGSGVQAAFLNKILETFHRLATFSMAFGPDSYTPGRWADFRAGDLLDQVYQQLEVANVSAAFIIWRRHLSEFEVHLSPSVVSNLLAAIPEEVPSSVLRPLLLHDFLPFIIRKLPEALPVVAAWLRQKALNLEILEPAAWPTNGLQTARLMEQCIEEINSAQESALITPGGSSAKATPKSADGSEDAMTQLQLLVQELEDLLHLRTKYNCPLTLAEFRKQNTESLIYRMLDQVPVVELIPSVVSQVVRPYMRERKLKDDKMLLQYVVDIGERQGCSNTISQGPTSWEEKALAVIKCISEPEYKVKAVLGVVHRASVPWSPMVESLVEEALRLDHQLVEELREQRRLVRLRKIFIKYSLRSCILNERIAWKLTEYIIRQDRETALEDALDVIVNFESTETNDMSVYKAQLDFFVYSDRAHDALKLVRSLPMEKALQLGRRALISAMRELNTKFAMDIKLSHQRAMQVTHTTCDILRYLLTAENEEDVDLEVLLEFTDCLPILEKIHSLQVEFGEFPSHQDYQSALFRGNLLREKVVSFFHKKLAEIPQPVTCDGCSSNKKHGKLGRWNLSKIYRFSDLLGFSRVEVQSEVVVQAADVGQVKYAINMARSLHRQNPGPQTAVLLYQLAHRLVVVQAEGRFVDECKEVSNLPSVVAELVGLAVTHCSSELLADCLELSKGCRLAEGVASQCEIGDYESMLQVSGTTKDPYQNWTFDSYYKEEGLVLDSEAALPLVNQYALSCISNIDCVRTLPFMQNRLAGSAGVKNDKDDGKEDVVPLVEGFSKNSFALVTHLEENNQLCLALSCSTDALFVISQHLCFKQSSDVEKTKGTMRAVISKAYQVLNNLKEKTVLKVFKQPYCDISLALGLLLNLPKNGGTKLLLNTIKMVGHNRYKQTANIATVGVDFATLSRDAKLKSILVDVQKKASWGHRLTKLGFGKEAKSLSFVRGASTVLSQIVQHEAITISLLRRFTRTFELDENDALLMYIHAQLLPALKPGQHRPTLQRATAQRTAQAIGEVSEQDKLLTELTNILKEIDPYDYERLRFVFDWIIQFDLSPSARQKSDLLTLLMMYKRVSPPSDFEVSCQVETGEEDPLGGNLSPLSPHAKTRLPFHTLVSGRAWKIISPELNASTVEVWVPMVKLLNLKLDQVFLLAIQNIVRQYMDHMKTVCQEGGAPEQGGAPGSADYRWDTTDAVTEMMAVIRRLLLSVSSFEPAMACANWIAKELPLGTAKVSALRACVMLSQKWLESCDDEGEEHEKAKGIFTKFEESCRRLSTEQVLYLHSLGEPSLLALCTQPTELIKELYQHASIQQRAAHVSKLSALPDIHAAAESISAVQGLSLPKIQLGLLNKWLPTAHVSQQNMSMTLDPDNLELTMGTDEEISEDEENLKRLVYLLQYGSLEKNVFYLLDYIFPSKPEKTNTMCQIRAMRCLFMIANKDIIETTVKRTMKSLEEHLQTLIYLHELEQLNLGHTLASFLKCNKDGLVRSIWRRHRHQKRAVKLVANLCLDYTIVDAPLWNSILKQLYAFEMLEHLRHVLVRLTEFPELWSLNTMPAMWKVILVTPLSEVSVPLSAAQEEECLKTLSLLHRCPCVLDLDLVEFADHFSRLELALCALSCVLLLPRAADRQTHADRLLQAGHLAPLRRQLDDWQTAGRQLPLREQIKTALYSYVKRHGVYGELSDPTYAAELATVLVKDDSIGDLLVYLLQNNRTTEALQLLALHAQVHPAHAAAVSSVPQGLQRIRIFARLYGLEETVLPLLPAEPEEDPTDSVCNGDDSQPDLPAHWHPTPILT